MTPYSHVVQKSCILDRYYVTVMHRKVRKETRCEHWRSVINSYRKYIFKIHIMHYIIRPYLWPVSHSVPDHYVQILWKQTRSTTRLWSCCDEGLLWEECSWGFCSSAEVNHKWEMATEYCLIEISCKGKEQFHCHTFYHTSGLKFKI